MKRDTVDHPLDPLGLHHRNTVALTPKQDRTIGAFAYDVIDQQFRYIVAQEEGVIADQDPEFVHQMRVGLRRFQAAIAVFSPVLGGNIDFKSGKKVLKSLGHLRDLDVQLQRITKKRKRLKTPGQQKSLIYLHRDLAQKRRGVYQQVARMLTRKGAYQMFKRSTKKWLHTPHYQAIAELPIEHCVPELLSPILSRLLLHPAWLLPETAMNHEPAFHDLRKLCKQVRYQGEFFLPLYSQEFKGWIKEIKGIQSGLGQLQDAHVFAQFLQHYQPNGAIAPTKVPLFDCAIEQEWESLRSRYTDPNYRSSLHRLILNPKSMPD